MVVLHTLSGIFQLAFALSILLSRVRARDAPAFTFRNMTSDDVDAVATTVVEAFDPGPLWTYLYQFRSTFPHYHWRCFRDRMRDTYQHRQVTDYDMVIVPHEEISNEAKSVGQWTMMINDTANSGSETVAGPSLKYLWLFPEEVVVVDKEHTNAQVGLLSNEELAGLRDQTTGWRQGEATSDIELPCSLHLDMNIARALHLAPQLQATEKEYIVNRYEYQLYLSVLATHPDWDGHGFGAAQVEWGMEKAKVEEQRLSQMLGRRVRVPVTLLATPAGYPLYKGLGFESVANVTLRLLDNFQGGTTWFEYMRWFPN